MCVPLFEFENDENPKDDQRFPGDTEGYRKKDDQRFPGDTEGYCKWENEYYNKYGHVPDYNGEP